MIRFIYTFFVIPALRLIFSFGRLFNKKIRSRESGLSIQEGVHHNDIAESEHRIWFHAASMGEFEQAKPVIELLKELMPDLKVIVSFFSPSGYLNQKNYAFADKVVYLPLDSKSNANRFIREIKPAAAVFVRYEIWLNYLSVLAKSNIPAVLICATKPGRTNSMPNFLLEKYYKSSFGLFKQIFTVDRQQTDYFKNLNNSIPVTTLTDTRYDRIAWKVRKASTESILPDEYYKPDDFVLVCGSTWPKDEDIIIDALRRVKYENKTDNIFLVIVPHEPTRETTDRLHRLIPGSVLLSQIVTNAVNQGDIIVDSIGKLLGLYKYAKAAYVGGAFGAGVHSVAEPAGYGIPLAAGTGISNSPDAVRLNQSGALTRIHNAEDMYKWLVDMIEKPELRARQGLISHEFIFKSTGSSKIIADYLMKIISD